MNSAIPFLLAGAIFGLFQGMRVNNYTAIVACQSQSETLRGSFHATGSYLYRVYSNPVT
jgi:hypothetical protein